MSDNENFGFGKFVPGFDFLQNLAKGASQALPQMPHLSNWIAPTLNPEELERRIGELKAVHFWLDQNSKALGATIQALEVQKMTLATLKGMNFSMGEVADALKLKIPESASSGAGKVAEQAAPGPEPVSAAAARQRRGRSLAMVGCPHPAVSADRGHRHEGRGDPKRGGQRQEHGQWDGQRGFEERQRHGQDR
jgi:hypothetical protein